MKKNGMFFLHGYLVDDRVGIIFLEETLKCPLENFNASFPKFDF